MVLGRIVHYTFDVVLLSTVVAGVRRSSGFSSVYLPDLLLVPSEFSSCLLFVFRPQTSSISDPTLRSVAERFFGVGESIFDTAQATAVNSPYFKKDSKR
jgi:hypothetical protein